MIRYRASWLSVGAFMFNVSTVAGTWLAAYAVRFNNLIRAAFLHGALVALAWVLPVYAVMFRVVGLYRDMWVFVGLPDLIRISKPVVAGALIVMAGAVISQPTPPLHVGSTT